MPPTDTYRTEIDGLRAIAVCGVILFHNFPNTAKGGFLGVDVFFVISGFLISSIVYKEIDQGNFNLVNFWERRIRRIFPVLFCLSIVTLIATYLIYLPIDFQNVGRSIVSLSLAASNIYFWLKTDYFGPTAETIPLLHTWSLSVEAQFYFFFPLLIIGIKKLSGTKVFFILFSIFALSIFFCIFAKGEESSAAFFLLPHRAWELLIGCLLATNLVENGCRNKNDTFQEVLTAAGLLLILSSFFMFNASREYMVIMNMIPCLGTALIIFANTGQITKIGRILSLRPISYIGKISYSLYLWHWVLLILVRYESPEIPSNAEKFVVMIIVVIVSIITYHVIELPLRRKIFIRNQSSLFTSLALSLLILFIVGMAIENKKGFPSRLDGSTLKKYQKAFEKKPIDCEKQNLKNNLRVCSKTPVEKGARIILWGDSHANTLGPLFDELASQRNITLWHYSCYPVLGVYRADKEDGLGSSQCYKSNNELIEYIKNNNVRNVVLASFWTQYTDGREAPIKGAGQFPVYYSDSLIKSKSRQDAKKVFKRNFDITLNVLTKLNVHVYIFKQVPQHLKWIPNQLAKFEKNGWNLDSIGRPLGEHAERQKFVNSVFEEFSQNDHVTILDPTTLLCQPNTFCKGVAGGQALYRDYNHLSLYGVEYLRSLFGPIFKKIENDFK